MFYIVLIVMFLLAAFYISTPEKEDEDISKIVVNPPTNAMRISADTFAKVQSAMGEYRDILEHYESVPMTLGLAEFMMLPEEEKNELRLVELLEKRKKEAEEKENNAI